MRLRILIGLVLLAAGGAVLLVIKRPGHELTGELGLTPDPSFTARFGGPLFDARTLRDEEGAPDVGYLTTDAPLTVTVSTVDSGGVARATLLVDGRMQASRAFRCPNGGCPRQVRLAFRPQVIPLGLGPHRLVVRAGSGSRATARAGSFTVNVGARPASAVEVEPRSSVPQTVDANPRPTQLDRTVRAAARRGPLASLIGSSALHFREHGRGTGLVSVLADVRPVRRGVRAVLPQNSDAGAVEARVAVLRDLVIDVDVARRRVVGLQPGPSSQVASWAAAPEKTVDSDDAPSTAFTPRRTPRLLQLSDGGPAFFTQDGDPVLRANGRDWPVSFVFTGHATVAKVKAGLRRLGFTRRGHIRYLGYRTPGGALRFDADRGLKTTCDGNATDIHARVYAPSRTDRFVEPGLGEVVVATVHLDHVDGCGTGPQLFGFSERAERRLATLIRTRLRWRTQVDAYPLGNAEPLRRDAADPTHVWLADGLATAVAVP